MKQGTDHRIDMTGWMAVTKNRWWSLVQKQIKNINFLVGYRITRDIIQNQGTERNKVNRKENWWYTTINQDKQVQKMFLDRVHKNTICLQ
jgi:hypothetical protein